MALSKISLSSIKPKPETRRVHHGRGVKKWNDGRKRSASRTRPPLTRVIDQYASVLASPDLVAPDLGIAASSVSENIQN